MAIAVTCTFCKRNFRVSDAQFGQQVKCPTCHEAIAAAGPRVRDHDVFISHSHKDSQTAFAVCAALESHGVNCWLAPRNVPSGETWGASIIDAIGDSVVMVLIFSAHSNESIQVLREIERAVSKKVEIIALRIDRTELSKDFEYFLSTTIWLDATDKPLEPLLEDLFHEVSTLISESTSQDDGSRKHRARRKTRRRSRKSLLSLAVVAGALVIVGSVGVWWAMPIGSFSTGLRGSSLDEGGDAPVDASQSDALSDGVEESDSDGLQALLAARADAPTDESKPEADAESAESVDPWDAGQYGAKLHLGPRTSIEFVWLSPGQFNMGSPLHDPDRQADETYHSVRLTNGFWMGKHEVTQEQWTTVMGRENNPSTFEGLSRPVENVSWLDAMKFLGQLEELTGHRFRLPTEAEWEYACRGEQNYVKASGDDSMSLTKYAWFQANSNGQTQYAGTLRPNSWGIFDIQGNVAEFCADRFGPYPARSVVNPVGPERGTRLVVRGGSWASTEADLRPAKRSAAPPQHTSSEIGFRICRDK